MGASSALVSRVSATSQWCSELLATGPEAREGRGDARGEPHARLVWAGLSLSWRGGVLLLLGVG